MFSRDFPILAELTKSHSSDFFISFDCLLFLFVISSFIPLIEINSLFSNFPFHFC